MINVKVTFIVNKPIKDLWKVTAEEFEKIGSWSTGIYKSWKTKEYDRICETSFGKLYEKITLKDEKDYRIEVDAKGLPFFVKEFTGFWQFKKITDKKTEATVSLNMKTMPIIGSFMGLFLKPQLEKGIKITVKDYIHFLEKGTISDRKKREKASLKK